MRSHPDSQDHQQYAHASIKTANDLRTIAQSIVMPLSHLTLPEIEQAVERVSKMVPAGNVPGVILNGLARLSERRPPPQVIKRDIHLLFRGVEQILDKAVYGAFFAGPAAVIWGYQNLLKLAGKSPDDAFPDGTWQFYVEYAMREDTARHMTETHGFDSLLKQHGFTVSAVDRLSAWAMTAIYTLHNYAALLENEWRERVSLRLLIDHLPDGYREWEKARPYARRADAGSLPYTAYRRQKFDAFYATLTANLPADVLRDARERFAALERDQLPAYIRQMTILSTLEPGDYAETRAPIRLRDAQIGLVVRGAYYQIPACQPNTELPANFATVRGQIAAILNGAVRGVPAQLTSLLSVKRAELPRLFKQFTPEVAQALDLFKRAPIVINADWRDRALPLAELRQTERGIGSHALTILDTGETFAFDQSHIYFDGAWGAALAEIMTNEALSWAQYFAALPAAQPNNFDVQPIHIPWRPQDRDLITQAAHIVPEVGAETRAINVKAILSLRKLFKARSDLIQLTVNDLLILYRAIHAMTYRPSAQLSALFRDSHADRAQIQAMRAAMETLHLAENPAILIPIDASQASPVDRLYPVSFEVPLNDLHLLDLHQQALDSLNSYENADGDRTAAYTHFDALQREYLATLAAFGTVMNRAKAIAMSGEAASAGTIKMLAHMPKPLQRLLDDIPSRFDVLNDIIKGREVFSNVGSVAPSSTLTRFITAKDDNKGKMLAWGVMTDANGTMILTLRDFRPHVALMLQAGLEDIAHQIALDYVESYAHGLNQFIKELRRITLSSRETRMLRGEMN